MSSELFILIEQLLHAQNITNSCTRKNPKPRGTVVSGSVSDAILSLIRKSDKTFFTEREIRLKTRRSHSAVSKALLYLTRNRLVLAVPDRTRNARYKKYRLNRE